MLTAKHIVETLGRTEMQERLGVATQSITNCIAENEFPARYYAVLKEMAEERELEMPLSLFNWRRAEDAA